MQQLAQTGTSSGTGINWDGLISETSPNLSSSSTIGQLVGGVRNFTGIVFFITIASGLAFIIYLILGGYNLMTSGGDPKKIDNGKHIITNALIGLFITLFAYTIIQLLAVLLGLDSLRSVF